MLVLTRRIGESLMIGDDIEVTLISLNNGGIRVGVNAPKDIPVHREEIYQRIAAHKRGDKGGKTVEKSPCDSS